MAAPAEVVRRLYEAPPDGFVAARDEAVAAARAAGDRDTAKAIAGLRKPTVAAWLVNLLALRRPELVDDLVELAAALRSAQRDLQGAELRELSAQRRKAVSALVAEAGKLAVAADRGLAGRLPLAEVEATLTAALADADVAEQVRSGRLIRSVEYAGFGEVPKPRLRLITGGDEPDEAATATPQRSTPADRAAKERQRQAAAQRRALERELASAQAAADRAAEQVDRAETAERDAAAALDDIEAQLIELERRRAAAQADLSQAKLARRAAQRDVTVARRRLGEVQGAIESLDDEPPPSGGSPRGRSRKAQSGT